MLTYKKLKFSLLGYSINLIMYQQMSQQYILKNLKLTLGAAQIKYQETHDLFKIILVDVSGSISLFINCNGTVCINNEMAIPYYQFLKYLGTKPAFSSWPAGGFECCIGGLQEWTQFNDHLNVIDIIENFENYAVAYIGSEWDTEMVFVGSKGQKKKVTIIPHTGKWRLDDMNNTTEISHFQLIDHITKI